MMLHKEQILDAGLFLKCSGERGSYVVSWVDTKCPRTEETWTPQSR